MRHHSQDRPLSSVLVGGKTPGEACHPLTRGAMDKIDVEISSDRARQQGLDVIVIVGITFRSLPGKYDPRPATSLSPRTVVGIFVLRADGFNWSSILPGILS